MEPRQQFAAAALTGLLASGNYDTAGLTKATAANDIARQAYVLADAMMREGAAPGAAATSERRVVEAGRKYT